jgi:hypothetical protein
VSCWQAAYLLMELGLGQRQGIIHDSMHHGDPRREEDAGGGVLQYYFLSMGASSRFAPRMGVVDGGLTGAGGAPQTKWRGAPVHTMRTAALVPAGFDTMYL